MFIQNKALCKYISEEGEKCIFAADKSDENKGYFANFKYCKLHEYLDKDLNEKNTCVTINKTCILFTEGDFSELKEKKCSFQYSDGDFCMFNADKLGYCLYHENNVEDIIKPITIDVSFKVYHIEQNPNILKQLEQELQKDDKTKCDYKIPSEDGGWENCKNIAKSIVCSSGNYLKVCDKHLFISDH